MSWTFRKRRNPAHSQGTGRSYRPEVLGGEGTGLFSPAPSYHRYIAHVLGSVEVRREVTPILRNGSICVLFSKSVLGAPQCRLSRVIHSSPQAMLVAEMGFEPTTYGL